MTQEAELLIEIKNTLEKILGLLSLQMATDRSMTETARMMKLVGMDNQRIAELLNTSSATVRTLTSGLHSRRK